MNDLGTLGGTTSHAVGVNQLGYIAGWTTDAAGTPHLVMWNPSGKIRSLGELTAEYGFTVVDINDRNEIVGSWGGYDDWAGVFRWTEQTGIALISVLYDPEAYAEGTNNRGDIVGWWCCGKNDVSLYGAFFAEEGTGFLDMGGVTNYAAYANAINDSKVVVGNDLHWDEEEGYHSAPFRWTPREGFRVLGSFGGDEGAATNINNRGEIVGMSTLASGEGRAFFWSESRGMVNLGPGSPMAINNEVPWIVGGRDGRATLWIGSGGVPEAPALAVHRAPAAGGTSIGCLVNPESARSKSAMLRCLARAAN